MKTTNIPAWIIETLQDAEANFAPPKSQFEMIAGDDEEAPEIDEVESSFNSVWEDR